MKKLRKRAIEKAERKLDIYEEWKEYVVAMGGSLQKGKDGKLHGVLRVE